MNKSTSLSSIALLSLLWERENRDYLDVLCQFILKSLPKRADEVIDLDVLVKLMRSKYGFSDIPRHVIEKGIVRLGKKRGSRPCYIRRVNRQYVTIEIFDSHDFDMKYSEMNRHISEVLDSLRCFLKDKYMQKDVDSEIAADMLFGFFESYGLTVINDSDKLRAITTANGETNFFIARFILDSIDRNTVVSERLLEITKGFLISKAVYYYSTEVKSSVSSKLKKTKFFLDCSIVIDALGYDSQGDEIALDEMCQLIKQNGGRVCVFEHTIEESSRLLESYASKQYRRNAFSFPGLESKQYPEEVLRTIASQEMISKQLANKGIEVIAKPSYDSDNIDGKKYYLGFQDESLIEKQIKSYSLRKGASYISNGRVSFDTTSLSAIGRIRRGSKPTRIENCGAIMVTQDWMLCQCMRDLYPSNFPPEIDFAIRDIDLVSLLWLSQENSQSQLPRSLLISYAFAACNIQQDIMIEAIDLATKLADDGHIPPEAALIVRSQSAIRPIIAEITKNNPSNLSEASIGEAVSEFVKRESEKEKIEAEKAGYLKGIAELSRKHEMELKAESDRASLLEEESRSSKNRMRKSAEDTATKWATRAKNVTSLILVIVGVLTLALSVYSWVVGGNAFTNISAVVLSVLGVLQILDYLTKLFGGFLRKIPLKVFYWTFGRFLRWQIKKKENISGISLSI